MKLFHISNAKKFKGSVSVVFDADQRLTKLDFSETDLTHAQIESFLGAIRAHQSTLEASFKSSDTVIVEGEFDISFDDFMREYPYKRNTHKAREYWPKLSKSEQAQAFIAAGLYRKYLQRNSWCNPKIADAWLKGKEFLNDWKNL